jgi:ergothioneine biosynthesis protein EgtB
MAECRASTLKLVRSLTPTEYYRQSHPDFSPVGWHLGHIAFTEALWMLEHLAGQVNPLRDYRQLFAADGLPKAARERLPDLPVIMDYLAEVREQVFRYLDYASLGSQLRLWWWLLQHESQHLETISIVLAMHRRIQGKYLLSDQPRLGSEDGKNTTAKRPSSSHAMPMVAMPEAEIVMGYGGIDAMDNEQPPFTVRVAPFTMDIYPVTQAAFREFIAAGGYNTPALWSSRGWSWRLTAEVDCPLYWPEGGEADHSPLDDHPVCGISYYEAEAYANFVGKRLPTEMEWERAACWGTTGEKLGLYPWGDTWPAQPHGNFGGYQGMTTPVDACSDGTHEMGCQDLLGNVWEWTSSWFEGYWGFQAFPYRGYSEVYFDGQHRVLRGGSWATRPWALRGPLRNWYYPHVREIFAGFRCVQDGA